MKSPLNLAFTLTLLFATQTAKADGVCTPLQTANLTQQYDNCKKVVLEGKMKGSSLDALKYTIKYFVANMNGLQDPSCAISGLNGQEGSANLSNPEYIKAGIKNQCSFVINDLKRPWMVKKTVTKKVRVGDYTYKNGKKRAKYKTVKKEMWVKDGTRGNRTTGYMVDLCATGNDKLVSRFYINGAKASPPFSDSPVAAASLPGRPSNDSSLAGAFLLNDRVEYNFQPFSEKSKAKYQVLADKIKDEVPPEGHLGSDGKPDQYYTGVPIIRMVGLNTSNNTTEFDKPFHVSAVAQGLGCVGVATTTHKIMQKLNGKGASLYMAYAGQEFEQRGNSCVNDSSDGYAPSSGGVPTAPVSTER